MIDANSTDKENDGEWSGILSWPIIPLHSIVLPNGNVLSFGSTEQGMQGGQFVYDLWDPVTNVHRTLPNTTGTNIFCSNMSIDATTGNVIIMGGDNAGTPGLGALSGNQNVLIFDYVNQEIRDAKPGDAAWDLDAGRYYGTTVALPNGEVMMIGGRDKDYAASTIPEIYNSETGVRKLPGAEIKALADNPDGSTLTSTDGNYWYPHAFVDSKGDVIVIEADGETIYRINTDGNGAVEQIGTLPFKSYTLNSSVMFDQDKIMILADDGGIWVGDLSGNVPTFTLSTMIDNARTNAGLSILPDGRVAITGGSSAIDQGNVLADAVKKVTIWDPETNTTTDYADQGLARLYHSSALILPDGTIFSGGGGAPGPLTNLNAEVFTPSYLYGEDGKLADRPEITDAPTNIDAGQTFTITVDDAYDIQMLSVTRSGAMTHGRNADARFLELDFRIIDATTIEVTTPANSNVLLPGVWMKTAIDKAGVPSVSSLLGVDMPDLVDTPPLVASSPIYNIEEAQINGAFELTVEARFDDLDGGNWQRIFDYGNGAAADNIFLTQVGNTDDMRFAIYKGNTQFAITAPNAITEGEIATWKVSVSDTGFMKIFKNGAVLAEGQGAVPNDVDRSQNFVGASNWAADTNFEGMIRNLNIEGNIDTTKAPVLLGTGGGHEAHLLKNGNFEDVRITSGTYWQAYQNGDVPGWKNAADNIVELVTYSKGQALDLDVQGKADLIYQDVKTENGKVYKLTFDVVAEQTGTSDFDVLWNDEVVASVKPDGTGSFEFSVKGTGGNDRLAFREVAGQNNGGGAYLDHVRLMPTTVVDPVDPTPTPSTITGTDGNDNLDGTAGDDAIDGLGGEDVVGGSTGNDTITLGDGYDQIDYSGKSTDYTMVRNTDGSITVTKPDGGVDTLKGVDGFWFSGEEKWYSAEDLAKASVVIGITEGDDYILATDGDDVIDGLGGEDVVGGSAGNDTITLGDGYDQIDYSGKSTDYTMVRNANGTITVTKPGGGVDTLSGVDGFWFSGEEKWYAAEELAIDTGVTPPPTPTPTITGTNGADTLYGTAGNDIIDGLGGEDFFFGSTGNDTLIAGDGYDQVDYQGASSDYSFALNDDGSVSVTKPDGGVDILSGIDGFWFQGDEKWLPVEVVLPAPATEGSDKLFGTEGNDVLNGLGGDDMFAGSAGNDTYIGGDGYDQVNYQGASTDYGFVRNGDGTITVTKADGGTDTYDGIDGVWFQGDETWSDISDLAPATEEATPLMFGLDEVA